MVCSPASPRCPDVSTAASGTLWVFVRRSIFGSPRRSLVIVTLGALVVGAIVMQVQVASGLRSSVRGALVAPSQRTLVVAIPAATVASDVSAASAEAVDRIASIDGVVAVGASVRFVETVAAVTTGSSPVPGQVGWADPDYLRLVVPGSTAVAVASAIAGGRATMLPKALRSELGVARGATVAIGGSTFADLGDPPSSFADPGLRDTAIVPIGMLGPRARFDVGTVQAAVLFDRVPDDDVVRLASVALFPDAPELVAVVSRGSVAASAARLDELTGSSGRTAVVVLGIAGWLIVGAIQVTMVQRRRSEIAVRLALGATPLDLVVGGMVESAVLGAAGGLVGVSSAGGVLAMVAAAGGVAVPPAGPSGALAAVVAGAVATVSAGLLPTLAAARRDPADVLRSLGDT